MVAGSAEEFKTDREGFVSNNNNNMISSEKKPKLEKVEEKDEVI
jgi:hypothetical protein